MKLVIEVLEKELERQNLLIGYSKIENIEREQSPLLEYQPRPPFIDEVYPQMHQLRDQLEEAIAYLKAKAPAEVRGISLL